MYKTILALLLSIIGSAALAAAKFNVGQRDYVFEDTARGRKIFTHVWYPVSTKIKTEKLKKPGPFVAVESAMDATPDRSKSKFPVVLISHGSGGTAEKLFWIVKPLVENGYVAIGVDHPGNMTGDNSGQGTIRAWDRPPDLTFALDRVDQSKEFKGLLDLTKLSAVGHSAGGTTVLLLSGARLSAKNLSNPIPKCGGNKDPYVEKFCKEMKAIDYRSYPKEIVEKDYSDKRIKAVVSLDPGLFASFEPSSFKKLSAKPLVIAAEKLHEPQDEIQSKDFAKHLSKDEFEILPGSYHMTFLQPCLPGVELEDAELQVLCANGQKKIEMQDAAIKKTLSLFEKFTLQAHQ
ncbi:MAG: hypothetical protein V4692_13445 [Bdellovibrionota bacterium]